MSFLEELQEAEETQRKKYATFYSSYKVLKYLKNKLFLISPKLKHANKEKQAQEAAFV